ncbi:hypothetical protein EON65_20385 [archaeon]|nr:MAG: hypothetical protein EON65_20385 [archaeon]
MQATYESELAKAHWEVTETQQKLEACKESLSVAQRNADGAERKYKSQETELADVYNMISEKDGKITRLTQLLTVLHEEKDALQIAHERETREMSKYRADSECKLQELQCLLDVEQLSSKEQSKSYSDLNNKYQQALMDLAAAKDDLLKKLELEALNGEQIKLYEITITDLKSSLATAKTRYDDVAQRLSNGIQELKSMQGKLHNALQAKEQGEHRLKDAELRNNLLQSDIAELQKQKEDTEATLQGRLHNFTEELNAAKLAIAGLKTNLSTLAIEKAEHSKTISTLCSRLERKEAEVQAVTERLAAEKEQLKQLLTRICWKASFFCEQVDSRLTQVQSHHNQTQLFSQEESILTEQGQKTPERSPRKIIRSGASPNTAKSPSSHSKSQYVVDIDGLESRIDHLAIKHEEVTIWCHSELQRLYTEQVLSKQELAQMKQQLGLSANDRKEMEELKVQLAEKMRAVDELQKKFEQQKLMTEDSRHAFIKLQKEYEHAEAIVTKQRQALEGANEVMKKQRFDLDDLHNTMQVKKQDQEEMSQVLMSQQKSIAESQLIIDHLNMLVHSLRSDKKCLEMEVKEYQDALSTVIQRFQKEFGSLQSQLADLNLLSLK